MSEYTQGICADGAAILKDGVMMTIEEILEELRRTPQPVVDRKCSECGNGEPDLSLYCVRCLNNDGWHLDENWTPQPVVDVNQKLVEALQAVLDCGSTSDQWWIDKAREALLSVGAVAAPQPVVPEGYVLVPVEPTEAILEALDVAMTGSVHGIGGWDNYIESLYKAMLSAGKETDNV